MTTWEVGVSTPLPSHSCLCTQTAASAQELQQFHHDAQVWLQLLGEEANQGENLKEEDFQEDKVSHSRSFRGRGQSARANRRLYVHRTVRRGQSKSCC